MKKREENFARKAANVCDLEGADREKCSGAGNGGLST